jgi:tetratricopeptide (TPR) repeat protein
MAEPTPNDDRALRQTAGPSLATGTIFTHRTWLLVLVLLIVTFAAYQSVWHAGFIWDDDDHLTANPAMTAPHGLRMIWSSLAVSRYYPLTLTTFWVQRRFWGLNPMPYHLVNIALHAINGILVFLVLRRLRVRAAWLAAMLWVLHPVNVESAAWITELKNTQSGALFFLAVLCFLRFETTATNGWYALALLCGLAAMLSKPSTVVLPLAMLLCLWWERGGWSRSDRGWRRADLRRIAPFFILASGMSAWTVIEQRGHILRAGTAEWKLSMPERLVIAGKAVWFYAAKLFWPVPLAFVYPRWAVDAEALSSWMPLAGLVVVAIVLWVWRRQVWARAGLFGFGFFVAALLPVLGFFDVYYFRYSFVADHFQYLASVGLIAVVASGAAMVCDRAGRLGRQIGAVAAAVVLLLLAALTWRQGHIYCDVETLWRDTLTKNPQCWMAHNNLGATLASLGRVPEAMGQYEQALRINPDSATAHNDLGSALTGQGRLPEAIAHYEQALRLKPNYPEAHNNLGAALMREGRLQEAISHYEQALRLRPAYPEAHYYLANALIRLGKVQEAIGHYEETLRLQPDFADAYNNLAWLLATHAPAQGGNAARSVTLAQRACELTDNRRAGYLDTLAAAYAAAGRFSEAVAAAQKAIELARAAGQPKSVEAFEARLELYRSGQAYFQTVGDGESSEAGGHVEQ